MLSKKNVEKIAETRQKRNNLGSEITFDSILVYFDFIHSGEATNLHGPFLHPVNQSFPFYYEILIFFSN